MQYTLGSMTVVGLNVHLLAVVGTICCTEAVPCSTLFCRYVIVARVVRGCNIAT